MNGIKRNVNTALIYSVSLLHKITSFKGEERMAIMPEKAHDMRTLGSEAGV